MMSLRISIPFVLALVITLALVPFIAKAQDTSSFSRQGIFGCSRNAAALSNSVGAFSATGGVYVPVADYTVELNTGTLVYVECVLRGLVDRESESADSALIKQQITTVLTGNNGNPLFQVNVRVETLATGDRIALQALQGLQNSNDSLSQSMAGRLVPTLAKDFTNSRQGLQQNLCPYKIDLNNCFAGKDNSADCANAVADPRCSQRMGPLLISIAISDNIGRQLAATNQQLLANGGFYSKTHIDSNGDTIVDTPGSVVQAETLQALTSGFRRVENANDVDQMVGALYAGLGTQVLTGSGGLLTGLTSAIGSGASYLTQMSAESSAGLRNAAANAALQTLAGWRAIEVQYNQVISAIANTFTQSIGQLQSAENQCWGLIEYNTTAKHVCATAPTGNTCTDMNGVTLMHIATTTQFSQMVINSQIAQPATLVAQNAQKSQQALAQIDQLIQGVSNTTSLDAQRLALVQLDQLVTSGQIHQQSDVTAAQQQQGSVTDTMTQLLTDTKTNWTSGTFDASTVLTTGNAWCNINDQSVIDYWDQQWR
jgi:hypothetical protein